MLLSQCGDSGALQELLQRLQRPLFSYIRRLVGPDAAEDVLQDVFLQICRDLRLVSEPQFIRAWAYRVCSRTCFAFLRQKRLWTFRHAEDVDVDTLPVDAALEANVLVAEIGDLLDQISPASRAVLVLHYFHNLTIQEVAVILQLSTGTAKSRLAYGLKCLRNAAERKI